MIYDQHLGGTFMFGADDLAANHAGVFSPGQQQTLQATAAAVRRGGPRRTVAMFVLFAFLIVVSAYGVASSGGDASQFAVVLGALAFFGVLIGGLLHRTQVQARRMLSAPLLSVQGVAKVTRHTSNGESAMSSYRAVIDGQRFVLDEERAAALDDGRAYRVYFAPALTSFVIMSIEPV